MVCSEMALTVDCIDGTVCYFHNQHMLLVFVPGAKRYSFIGAVLSRLDTSGIVNVPLF
jgi:hypothetical protein